jgi:hypothetical protein
MTAEQLINIKVLSCQLAEGEELGSNILSQNFARFRTSSPCMIGQSNMQRAPIGLFADGLTIYHPRGFSWRAALRLSGWCRRL